MKKKWKPPKAKPPVPVPPNPQITVNADGSLTWHTDDPLLGLISNINHSGGIHIVTLKNGVVFQIHDASLIRKVIEDMGSKATDMPYVSVPTPASYPSYGYVKSILNANYGKIWADEEDDEDDFPKAEPDDFGEHGQTNTINKLQELLGPLATKKAKCPQCGTERYLWSLIQHINDTHQWKREDIADWLETLDMDLTLAYVVKCEWCEKTYHDVEPFGQHICSKECGEKLAEFDKENEEVKDPEKRKALISAYRELDSIKPEDFK